MSTLPLELHYAIIQDVLTVGDLRSLALCCSAFRDEAQGKLFFHPRISTRSQQHKFVNAILGSPARLAPLVHIYSHQSGRELHHMPGGTYAELATALRAMCNLTELSLQQTKFFPHGILDGCTFKLKVFHWGNGGLPVYQVPYILQSFLPTQSTLKHLAIRGSLVLSNESPPLQVQIITKLCPMLESLSGDKDIVDALLRNGRSIKRLQWLNEELPALTVFQLGQLEHLELLRYDIRRSTETKFATQLTALLFLEIFIEDVGPDNIANNLQFLASMPRLRILVVRKSPVTLRTLWQQSASPQLLGHDSTIQKFFERSKSVKRVFVQKYVGGAHFEEFLASENHTKVEYRVVCVDNVKLWTQNCRLE
ncbi:hypothetical protein D9619_004882 [Psilocybe cf. subviscida]|uniref:F-box domain-containing protein n=1 Tax=Psilocybe cf. subviscida TaxID=2480587 RepID=A0A8H5BPU3_9AGAR|nr:hypothetical protein D9619_004882 [Psilocybe cf. subviscida]